MADRIARVEHHIIGIAVILAPKSLAILIDPDEGDAISIESGYQKQGAFSYHSGTDLIEREDLGVMFHEDT